MAVHTLLKTGHRIEMSDAGAWDFASAASTSRYMISRISRNLQNLHFPEFLTNLSSKSLIEMMNGSITPFVLEGV